jgi:hypothetical protein
MDQGRDMKEMDDRPNTTGQPDDSSASLASVGYVSETSFVCDGSIVYNLRQTGWRKGKPEMSNDIAVYIQGNHLPESLVKDIAETICTALNRRYVIGT